MNGMRARRSRRRLLFALFGAATIVAAWWNEPPMAEAATTVSNPLRGQVLGAGAPIVDSTVTLWAASEGAPAQLAQTRTGADGSFAIGTEGAGTGASLYLVARGGRPVANRTGADNARIALITVLGAKAPDAVTINEFTTIASVWTH